MSLGNSQSRYPTASFAAILAIGKPVALDAKALERLTRGFISITIIRPGIRVDRKLNVRATCFHADFANHGEAGIAHSLVFFVGKRLGGATVIESPV